MVCCIDSISISKNVANNNVAFIHNLISTSYHEAGHTIYGLLHLARIESVQVMPFGKNKVSGFTHFDFLTASDVQSNDLLTYIVKSEICLIYAGLTAEKFHFKTISGSDTLPIFLKDGSSDDTKNAAKLIKKYKLATPGKQRYKLKKKLISNTLKELQDNWNSVSIIAHGLFQKKRLYYSDIKSLLINNDDKKFWKDQFKIIDNIYENYKVLDEKELRSILIRRKLL